MATAELAVALPVLVFLLLVGVAAIEVAQAKLRCVDAVREAARAFARGDPGVAVPLARSVSGGAVSISHASAGPGLIAVSGRVDVRPVPWLGPISITDRAVVAAEPGTAQGNP